MSTATQSKPLKGITVIEMGQLIAGPFAGSVLAYFGAEVIKIESPDKGDPLRGWRKLDEDGTSYWWRSLARNKKSITVNLREAGGREIASQLIAAADVLIENFRPGTMEKWGLGPERFLQSNPGLIYNRVSGYGQTGPYAKKAGFASVCEAFGGFRYVNGFADRPPVRPNLSIGDTLAGMHAVIGILMALLARERLPGVQGQQVDVSIFESVFNLMEGVVPEYSGAGEVREPSGSTLTGIVPTNTYQCADGKYVVIGANGDSLFKRLMIKAGRADMAEDIRFADNAGRVKHEQQIDAAISAWTASLTSTEVLQALEEAVVPGGPIYSVEDMFNDPHYQARGLFQQVGYGKSAEQQLQIPAIPPVLQKTPGTTEWAGPELGEHTETVLMEKLGKSADEIAQLRQQQIL